MEIKQCESCRGQKKVMGLGLMEHNCLVCKGVGFVERSQTIPLMEKNDDNTAINGKNSINGIVRRKYVRKST